MKLYSFGGIQFPETLESETFPVSARSALMELRDGSFDEDGSTSVFRPYQIEASFVVGGPAGAYDVDDKIDRLLQAMREGHKVLKAIMRDCSTYRQTFAKIVGTERQREYDMSAHQPLTLSFLVDYPLWMATEDEPHYLNNGDRLNGTWTLDAHHEDRAIAASPDTFTIANAGTAEVRRGTILVTPRAGASLTSIRFRNVRNDQWVRYTGAVGALSQLQLELLPKSCKVDAVNAYSGIDVATGQMDWMTLETGDNPIEITVGGLVGTVDVEWFWSRHYI